MARADGDFQAQYARREFWYQTGLDIDTSKPDVFYVVSTMVLESYDAQGNPLVRTNLDARDRALLDQEFDDISAHMFDDSFNLFAPYYHELTMNEAMKRTPEERKQLFIDTLSEVSAAFDYYLAHLNGGRPFVLAGYSQGSVMVKGLLKHMTDEQYSLMAAAYVMGGPLSAEDLQCPHIVAAQRADDLGVSISYNSVAQLNACWGPLTDAAACINPVNWATDTTPATFVFGSETGTVRVDPQHHVLIVEGLDPQKHHSPDWPFPLGNYHADEIHFYAESVRNNALLRLEKLRSGR